MRLGWRSRILFEMTAYEKYSELKSQIAELEEQARLLGEEILEKMQKQDIQKYKTSFGTFSIGHRRQWDYPDYVRELTEELKLTTLKAKRNGDAKASKVPFLAFRARSEEDIETEEELLGPKLH